MGMMQELAGTSTLFGSNAPFIEELYERYLADPASVDAELARVLRRAARRRGRRRRTRRSSSRSVELARNRRVARRDGRRDDDAQAGAGAAPHQQVPHARHARRRPRSAAAARAATTSPTSTSRPTASPTPTWTPSSTSARTRRARRACACATSSPRCKETYTRTLGAEYMYITDTATKRFFQERLEPIRSRPNYSPDERKHILERLTAAETLERYLHTKYVGQKRFSGEGGDTHDPDARPPDREGGRRRRGRDRDGHGASRPPQRARQHPGQDAGEPLLASSRARRRRSCRRATSSTTRASRRTCPRPAARCT